MKRISEDTEEVIKMPRINFDGQDFNVPNQVNGADLKNLLGLGPNEVPVKIGNDGGYEPVKDKDEYHINDETSFSRIHRLENG
jgi:hypothetical protein